MGAHPYWYVVKYQPDLEAALQLEGYEPDRRVVDELKRRFTES